MKLESLVVESEILPDAGNAPFLLPSIVFCLSTWEHMLLSYSFATCGFGWKTTCHRGCSTFGAETHVYIKESNVCITVNLFTVSIGKANEQCFEEVDTEHGNLNF